MTKRQIIDAIMRINRTARAEFLAEFSERELLEYLEHLRTVYDLPCHESLPQPALVA
ncbi:MAG: hypothetical protein JXQ73_16220 [Phycisphaerae bacterium]|nr:hypothetical protein [Phycisphaerae bacterium]